MFDVAPTELLLLAVVALVVIGPKDLPRAMRFVGQWVGRARGMARHFRTGIDEMIRQSELEEMEKKWREENERIMRELPTLSGPNSLPDFRAADLEAQAALPAPGDAMPSEGAPPVEATPASADLAHWEAAATPAEPEAIAPAAAPAEPEAPAAAPPTPAEEQLSLLPPDPEDPGRDGKSPLP